MKSKLLLLSIFCNLTIGAGIANAVNIETAPIEQNSISSSAGDKQSTTIGPRDPEKDKSHGVGVNVFMSKNLAVSSSVSVFAPEPNLQTGQIGNSGGLGLNASQVGGTVGLKMFFK